MRGVALQTAFHEQPDPGQVITKACLRTAQALGLSGRELAKVIGTSASTVSRLGSGATLRADSKEAELALWLVRVYRSLDAQLNNNNAAAQAWMRAPNHALGGVPAELIQTVGGLVHVVSYLDGMRGRN